MLWRETQWRVTIRSVGMSWTDKEQLWEDGIYWDLKNENELAVQ